MDSVLVGFKERGDWVRRELDTSSWLNVKEMMKTDFNVLKQNDTLRTVIRYYQDYKLTTLPVIDEDGKLLGVFPKKRLFKALLGGAGLDDPCTPYIVYNPVFVSSEVSYNEVSLAVRVTRSKVDYVVVVDNAGKVVGLIGTAEYLRGGMEVIKRSYSLSEAVIDANYEAVIVVDDGGHILKFNPAAEGMFGMQFTEIKGKLLKEVLPDINIMNKRSFLAQHIIASIPVLINQMPIFTDEEYTGTVITLWDTSEIEAIANELETVKEVHSALKGVMDASQEGVIVADSHGIVKYCNERAGEMFLKTPENIIGASIRKLIKSEGANHVLINGYTELEEYDLSGKKAVISYTPICKLGVNRASLQE